MSDKIRCPACSTLLRVPAGATAGAMIQCPQCEAKLSIPGTPPSRPAAKLGAPAGPRRPGRDDDFDDEVRDEEEARPRLKKKPRPLRPRPKSAGPGVGVMVAVVLGLIFLVGGAIVGLYLMNQKRGLPPNGQGGQPFVQNEPRGQGRPPAPNPRQDPPNGGVPADEGPADGAMMFTLSNGKVYNSIRGLTFEADFAVNGQPQFGGIRYNWVIKSSSGKLYVADYNLFELQRSGSTLAASAIGGFGDGAGATFECWLEEKQIAAFRDDRGKRISNVLTLQPTAAPDGPPFGPRGPGGGPLFGPRGPGGPPFGPRGPQFP